MLGLVQLQKVCAGALAGKVQLSMDDKMSERMRESSLVELHDGVNGPEASLDLEEADLTAFKMSFGSRVEIRMTDGQRYEREEEVPAGGAGRPPSEKRAAVEQKFLREVGVTVGAERAATAIKQIEKLEELTPTEVGDLVRLVCR